MADAIAIKITNLAEIKRAFDKSPTQMTKQLNIAIEKAVFLIQRGSMINTPVATGRLRASTKSKFGNLKGEVGTNTDYDIFVHNGTKFMTARPYLKDAVESSEVWINGFFQEAVDNVLSSIGKSV